ncbi:glycoside hydrolase family 130 protein [Zhouia sp. PK063]|uniref:glycoside hydrolase family 130 protein n=1 Tax=Zhouia sp. PK063 TaxID=3373602 RepID=UPI0037A421D0
MKKPFLIFLISSGLLLLSCKQTIKKDQDKRTIEATENTNDTTSWAITGFKRPNGVNPVLSPIENAPFFSEMNNKNIDWESNDVFNPAATIMGDSIYVLYRAEDKSGVGIGERTSRIGLASSANGIEMHRDTSPVLYPKNDDQKAFEWPGGCEDPRVAVTEEGTYVMLYTQWNKKVPRLGVATSTNLRDWTKHGPAFEDAYQGKYKDMATKSASLLTELKDGKLIISKVDGRYFMYWGEQHVYAATSDNLTDWTPLEDDNGELKILMSPRAHYFDSQLTECGPPAIKTDKGIVLMYNGKNLANENGDTNYTPNSYCAGQALFDNNDPTKFVDRLDKPFLIPTASFEKSGQYPAGTVFIEGLVYFKDTWYLYYGCADSRVAVVIREN